MQVFCYLVTVLLCLMMGLMAPSSRTWYIFQLLMYWAMSGMGNGYCTARAIKYFGAGEWRFAASASAIVLPSYIVITFMTVDMIEWFEKSSQILPFSSIILLMFCWICVNVPFTYYGSYQAFRLCKDVMPRVSSVHRAIPAQPWYLQNWFMMPCASFISFSVVAYELHWIITSVWRSYLIGMFVFLFINVYMLCTVTGLVSIAVTYLKL